MVRLKKPAKADPVLKSWLELPGAVLDPLESGFRKIHTMSSQKG